MQIVVAQDAACLVLLWAVVQFALSPPGSLQEPSLVASASVHDQDRENRPLVHAVLRTIRRSPAGLV